MAALAQAVPASAPALPTRPLSGHHRLGLKCARAFCEALFSSEEGPPPAARMDWLMGELDALFQRAGWRSGGFYKLSLMLVNLAAPLAIRSLRPLWRLPLKDRVEALVRLERGPLAPVVLAAKSIICIIYYEHPDAAKEIGYTPPKPLAGGAT